MEESSTVAKNKSIVNAIYWDQEIADFEELRAKISNESKELLAEWETSIDNAIDRSKLNRDAVLQIAKALADRGA